VLGRGVAPDVKVRKVRGEEEELPEGDDKKAVGKGREHEEAGQAPPVKGQGFAPAEDVEEAQQRGGCRQREERPYEDVADSGHGRPTLTPANKA